MISNIPEKPDLFVTLDHGTVFGPTSHRMYQVSTEYMAEMAVMNERMVEITVMKLLIQMKLPAQMELPV